MSATPIETATITRTTTAQELLDLARQSPAAVAAHDKNAWLGLFADRHVVEDPVGGRPVLGGLYDRRSHVRGRDPLARFWDTFIAPNDIRFHVENEDIVSGLDVVRDVTIETRLGGGVVAKAPMHLVYETTLDEGAPRIRRIAAHWEVAPMFAQVVGVDRAKLAVAASMSVRMLRLQGVGGSLAFGLRRGGDSRRACRVAKHRTDGRRPGTAGTTLSMGELGATIMVYPATWKTLPVAIFGLTDRGQVFQAAANTTLLLLVTLVALLVLGRVRNRR